MCKSMAVSMSKGWFLLLKAQKVSRIIWQRKNLLVMARLNQIGRFVECENLYLPIMCKIVGYSQPAPILDD